MSPSAQFRYGAVFVLTLVVLVFLIVAPETNLSRAVAIALEGLALVVTVATSRARPGLRRARELTVAIVAGGVVVAVGSGLVPTSVALLMSGIIAALIPLALGGGLLRLIRARGVTVQAVAGSLAVYLLIGLLFTGVTGFVARAESGPFFAQHTSGNESIRVYYSFTVLTTTGFGDYTAANPTGRAIAVIEMLTGQLYLVTVIGVLVGSFAARPRPSPETGDD